MFQNRMEMSFTRTEKELVKLSFQMYFLICRVMYHVLLLLLALYFNCLNSFKTNILITAFRWLLLHVFASLLAMLLSHS